MMDKTTPLSNWSLSLPDTGGVTCSELVAFSFSAIIIVASFLFLKRQETKRLLENCGLPTVNWRPKFVSYSPFEEEQKLASSTITRILPRMKRLGGPFGMYGTVYGISSPVVHVAHPTPARAIFGTTSTGTSTSPSSSTSRRRSSIVDSTGASKAPAYDHFKDFCGEGVFTADGEDWKAKRAAVMHCLVKGINSSTSTVSSGLEKEANRAADFFCSQVERLQEGHDSPVTANVVPLLQKSTVGLIYRYITHSELQMGCPELVPLSNANASKSDESSSVSSDDETTDSNSQQPEGGKAISPSVENTNLAGQTLEMYMSSIIRIRMIILAQSRSIWFLLPRWCYHWFSSLHRDEQETVAPIHSFARTACMAAKPESPLGKLQHFECYKKSHRMVDDLSKDLLDEAVTLLFAGQDTSAATLSWTLHLLSLYPDIQSKVKDEICAVAKEEGLSSKEKFVVTRNMIGKMTLLDAVIKESMRLYPVAPFVVRRLSQDTKVKDCNELTSTTKPTVLPAGSIACIWIYGLHRNPEFWSRPDDFVPERWINPDLKDIGQTNGAYMPFAAGPRNCVGQPLARVVLRTLLTRLLYQYDFRDDRLVNDVDPSELRKDMQAGFTVLPSGGATLTLHKRQK